MVNDICCLALGCLLGRGEQNKCGCRSPRAYAAAAQHDFQACCLSMTVQAPIFELPRHGIVRIAKSKPADGKLVFAGSVEMLVLHTTVHAGYARGFRCRSSTH
jgi:hypothetical protein